MRNELVVDIETKNSFGDVGGPMNRHLLGVSLAGAYDYLKGDYLCFDETELSQFMERLKTVERVIGFNIKSFDWEVLQPYTPLDLKQIETLDIMEDAVRAVRQRVSLNNLVGATLGLRKSGTGLEALRLFREGKLEELRRYCLDDVRLTRDLYEFGLSHGYILATSPWDGSRIRIPVEWNK